MTSKELELLAKMTVKLLKMDAVEFVIETWESIIEGSESGDGRKGEKGQEGR